MVRWPKSVLIVSIVSGVALTAILLVRRMPTEQPVIQKHAMGGDLVVKFQEGTDCSRIKEISGETGAVLEEKMAVGDPDLYRVSVSGDRESALHGFLQYPEVIKATKIPAMSFNPQQYDDVIPDELLIKFRACTPPAIIDEVNRSNKARVLNRFFGDPDLYHVGLPPGTDLNEAERLYAQDPNVIHVERNPRIKAF